jgi:hypothetical protein
MPEDLAISIRRSLSRYLSNEQTLRQFLRGLTPKLARVGSDERADDVAHEIYIRVAEYTNGDWTESELKELLRPLVSTYRPSGPPDVVRMHTDSSTSVTTPAVTYPAGLQIVVLT